MSKPRCDRPVRRTSLFLLLPLVTILGCSPSPNGRISVVNEPKTCFKTDSLGFKTLNPNATCRRKVFRDGQLVQDSTAKIDKWSRRVVPASDPKATSFLAFLGCSFTYGDGVTEVETFPNQLGLIEKPVADYNYGVFTFGPNDVLETLQARDLSNEILKHKGKFIYLWFSDHMYRSIGALSHASNDRSPHYEMDSNGIPQLLGSFRNSQPIKYKLFDLLRCFQLGERLGFNLPPRFTESHYRLVTGLFRAMERLTKERFPESEFYIVIYPEPGDELATRSSDVLKRAFSGTAIHVLDYHDRYFTFQGPASLPDGHPTAAAYRELALWVAKDLGK